MGIWDQVEYDMVGYRYFKLIQGVNFENSSTLVSFGGRWWETMRGVEHDGNYTGFTVLGFDIVMTVPASMQLMYV